MMQYLPSTNTGQFQENDAAPFFFRVDTGVRSTARENITPLTSLLDGFSLLNGHAHLIVQKDGTYLASTTNAEDMLRLTCLCIRRRTLTVTHPHLRHQLKKLLDVDAYEVKTIVLSHEIEDGHVIARSVYLGNDLVCLALHDASKICKPEIPDLTQVFRLTNAEAEIVFCLYCGQSPAEIAVNLGNSIHTIRSHIRRSYDKLGIKSREELWQKINTYRIF